jgi:hypothetical protein
VQRKRGAWPAVLRQRRISSYKFRSANKIEAFRSQRWDVQRLANVASRIRPIGMFVEETSTGGKIQNRGASQYRQRALPVLFPEFVFPKFHKFHWLTLYRNTLDASGAIPVVQKSPIQRIECLTRRSIQPTLDTAYFYAQ